VGEVTLDDVVSIDLVIVLEPPETVDLAEDTGDVAGTLDEPGFGAEDSEFELGGAELEGPDFEVTGFEVTGFEVTLVEVTELGGAELGGAELVGEVEAEQTPAAGGCSPKLKLN
jgi:hypothetical protein